MSHAPRSEPRDELAERRARVAPDGQVVSVSQRHWDRVAGDASSEAAITAAADRLCLQLENGLSRWIGIDGYRTLQERAIHEVIDLHPALAKLTFAARDHDANLAAVKAHGSAEVADGMVAFVAAVIELLGRIIGPDMALRLVEHWGDRAREGA